MPSIHSGWSSPCCHRRCSDPSTLQLESHCGELALFSLCLVPPSPCSITKERTEVIFQGTLSQDPKDPAAIWEEYQFLCKPGDVYRRPCLISPYHYRLDWLMWFAAFQVTYVESRSNRNLFLWYFSNFFLSEFTNKHTEFLSCANISVSSQLDCVKENKQS